MKLKERLSTYFIYIGLFLGLISGIHLNVSARQFVLLPDSIAITDSLQLSEDNGIDSIGQADSITRAEENRIKYPPLSQNKTENKKKWTPVPNNSIWFALAIPGAGQIYNRKYWKLPIIYGGFVGCAYALSWNGKMYNDYSQAYQDIMSSNPQNNSYMDFLGPGITQEEVLSDLSYYQSLFQRRKDLYRRQRDLSIFAFIAVYLLSIIDAYVDAELSNFDISNDLGMTLEPTIFNEASRSRLQGVGLQCSIIF